jgi:anaerobic ribonucleoside-triphosphate reductase activating protein
MKYLTEQIVFQEVPNEISLAFEITNCPRKCPGCHTPELQCDCGNTLTKQIFHQICEKYSAHDGKYLFTCVLFLGGEQHHSELIDLLILCRNVGLKTALYTGANSLRIDVMRLLNYVKLGEYNKELGGLDSPKTNQMFVEII